MNYKELIKLLESSKGRVKVEVKVIVEREKTAQELIDEA
jgi:hypothetical protein